MSTRTTEQQRTRDRNRDLYNQAVATGRDVVPHRPLEVYLEITTHCNIRCVFCAREHDLGYLTGQRVGNIRSELLSSVTHLLDTAEVVYPLGFGEPLLHREFLDIVERARGVGASVQFNTNGTILGEKEAKRLVDARADILVLSLDGATKQTFESIRLGASFDTIVSNMKRLDELKREAGTVYPRIYVEFVALRSNFHELPRLVELAHEIGAVGVHVEPLVPHSPELETERIPTYTREPYRSAVAEARRRAAELGVGLVGRGITGDLPALTEDPQGAAVAEGARETTDPLQDTSRRRVAAEARNKAQPREPGEAERSRPEAEPIDQVPTDLLAVEVRTSPARGAANRSTPDPPGEGISPGPATREPGTEGSSSSLPEPEPSIELDPSAPIPLLCSQPFTTLYVGYRGRVGTCCLGNHELGDLNTQSIDEIWNGPKFQALRAAMRSGEVPLDCRSCVEQGRIPPMRHNDPKLSVVRPEVRYEAASPPRPVEQEIPLDLSILEARTVPQSRELYLKAAFSMGWDSSLHAEVHVEALQHAEDGKPRPLLAPARANFPPGYDEVRSLRLCHGLAADGKDYPERIRITVKDVANGRVLITREAEVSGA